ncbi:MAG: lipoyl synthase [Candidatus Dormibacteria bacterium]
MTAPVAGSAAAYRRLLPDGVDRRPAWLTVRLPTGDGYHRLKGLMRDLSLNTVCEEARCPNIGECWGQGTATFMILGDVCTRACAFCAVTSGRRGGDIDAGEPARVGEAVARMGLRHAVVTSVDRDDLPDLGAGVFAATIREIRRQAPGCTVEVLTPDFNGSEESLATVMAEAPEIFNHNLETVSRLYARVRPKAGYRQSLELLRAAHRMQPAARIKSGLMLGLGESADEVRELLRDMRTHDVEIVTIGQYLRPSAKHHPIVRFVPPEEFAELGGFGRELGFSHVESGPLVRSSYHAAEQAAPLVTDRRGTESVPARAGRGHEAAVHGAGDAENHEHEPDDAEQHVSAGRALTHDGPAPPRWPRL